MQKHSPTQVEWRLRGALPRYRKKLQVAGRRQGTFKFIDCPARLITTSLKTYQLSPSIPQHYCHITFYFTPAVSPFFIASYYCPLNFKCSAGNFRCLGDLRGAISKCFIVHKCEFATCWDWRSGVMSISVGQLIIWLSTYLSTLQH